MSNVFQARLLEVWKQLHQLRVDAANELGEKAICNIQFRGHNERSSNYVKPGTMSLWINLNWEVDGHNQASVEITERLTKAHLETLFEFWIELLDEFEGQVERVVMQLPSSTTFVPAIHLVNVDQSTPDPYVYSLIL